MVQSSKAMTGGPSSDTVYDNKVDNVIKTGGGDDTIHLSRGYDIVRQARVAIPYFYPLPLAKLLFKHYSMA